MGLTHFPHGVSSFGQTLYGGEAPVMGKSYHVRKTTDANYDEWKAAVNHRHYDGTMSVQTTIEGALDLADDYDTIWVYPGQWKPLKTLAITQKSLRLLAVQTGPFAGQTGTEIRQWGNVACDIITVNGGAASPGPAGASNVEIAGFRFTPYGGTYTAISVGTTINTYGVYIHDNYFMAAAQLGSMLLLGTAGGYNADSIHICNNYFKKGGGAGDQSTLAAIVINYALNFLFMDNHCEQVGSGQYFIYCNSTDKTAGKFIHNTFFASETGAKAIRTGTLGVGDFYFSENRGVNYADGYLFEDSGIEGMGYNTYGPTAEAADAA